MCTKNQFPCLKIIFRKVIYLNVYLQHFHAGMFRWRPRRQCSHSALAQGGFPSAISTSTCRYEGNPGHMAIFRFSLIMFSSWGPRQREDLFIPPWGNVQKNDRIHLWSYNSSASGIHGSVDRCLMSVYKVKLTITWLNAYCYDSSPVTLVLVIKDSL